MSGGTAYVLDLQTRAGQQARARLRRARSCCRSTARTARSCTTCWSGTSRRPIRRSPPGCSRTSTTPSRRFVKVLPRDYAAVLQTRQDAVDEGLDPDGDVVWNTNPGGDRWLIPEGFLKVTRARDSSRAVPFRCASWTGKRSTRPGDPA